MKIIKVPSILFVASSLLALSPLSPTPKSSPKKESIVLLVIPNDGVTEALTDLLTINPHTRPYIRYIFIRSASKIEFIKSTKANSLSMGMISRSIFPNIRPTPISDHVVRINLLLYAPNNIHEYINYWEELRFDPDFNQLISKDEINNQVHLNRALNHHKNHESDIDLVRINDPSLNQANYNLLQHETESLAPIVSDQYLAWRILSADPGKNLYKIIWGGLYYKFRGIRQANVGTDLDLYLEDAGIGHLSNNKKENITANILFERLRSDQRVAIFKSGVTGKPRRVDWYHTPDGRDGTGAVSITHDLSNDDVDIGTHPLYTLLVSKPAAFEVIREGTNGFPVYAIFDGQQKLLNFADASKVVADRTVPNPFPPVLVPAISCLACHCTQGDRGWKPLTNDAKRLTANNLNVLGDLSQKRVFDPDTIERIAGLYTGNFDKAISRAKEDFDETTLRCAGPWNDKDILINTKTAWSYTVDRCRNYWYEPITPKIALQELGLECPKNQEINVLKLLLPPVSDAIIIDHNEPFILENPVLAALKEGISVPRWDWDLQKSFAAQRAQKVIKR